MWKIFDSTEDIHYSELKMLLRIIWWQRVSANRNSGKLFALQQLKVGPLRTFLFVRLARVKGRQFADSKATFASIFQYVCCSVLFELLDGETFALSFNLVKQIFPLSSAWLPGKHSRLQTAHCRWCFHLNLSFFNETLNYRPAARAWGGACYK